MYVQIVSVVQFPAVVLHLPFHHQLFFHIVFLWPFADTLCEVPRSRSAWKPWRQYETLHLDSITTHRVPIWFALKGSKTVKNFNFNRNLSKIKELRMWIAVHYCLYWYILFHLLLQKKRSYLEKTKTKWCLHILQFPTSNTLTMRYIFDSADSRCSHFIWNPKWLKCWHILRLQTWNLLNPQVKLVCLLRLQVYAASGASRGVVDLIISIFREVKLGRVHIFNLKNVFCLVSAGVRPDVVDKVWAVASVRALHHYLLEIKEITQSAGTCHRLRHHLTVLKNHIWQSLAVSKHLCQSQALNRVLRGQWHKCQPNASKVN